MNETMNHPALLPAGMRDVLPPEAEVEARTVERLMEVFAAHGFARVEPPLLEFEDSLFAGAGAATAEQTFRVMDPESQRMLGFRADTTPQVGRLAATRLAGAARPLRLAYAGQCLRVRGGQTQPERQVAQAGIELIGHDSAAADAEIILVAAEALAAVGILDLSFDLTAPPLVAGLLRDFAPARRGALARALERKDASDVAALGGAQSEVLLALLAATGAAEAAVPALLEIELPAPAWAQAARMAEIVAAVRARNATVGLTVDPVEFRGYRYHTGVCATVFCAVSGAELGQGGRYLCGEREPATGLTLYPDTIVRVAPAMALKPRVYVPVGADGSAARAAGFATVAGLELVGDVVAEARRQKCSHWLRDGRAVEI